MAILEVALERDNCCFWSVFKLGPPLLIQVVLSRTTKVWSGVVRARSHDGDNHHILAMVHVCLSMPTI